eukprot:CAMPEP_0175909732 /NCGR_PEP_ID=MMETSP0108-20121206/7281_1 /TAXON_ID=195067 ORGANISM="Goniomonas pacifica, Strain CCMP1869" /NCGR_SAMPLE_ID=MMETSP0108 /ASSEMBLY_ACC=CAM_ASM_000204 /LENGTH=65 /DNA_ID=CAMNT_0017231859 /DNA_START=339 /DNA_END=536 /DNA_ORIENTATION=+
MTALRTLASNARAEVVVIEPRNTAACIVVVITRSCPQSARCNAFLRGNHATTAPSWQGDKPLALV